MAESARVCVIAVRWLGRPETTAQNICPARFSWIRTAQIDYCFLASRFVFTLLAFAVTASRARATAELTR